MNRSLASISVLVLAVLACSTSSPVSLGTPTSLFGNVTTAVPSMTSATSEPGATQPAATLASTLPPAAANEFTVAVIVDKTNQSVTREQAQAVIDEASSYLHEHSPIALTMVDFTEDSNDSGTADIANRYAASRMGALPDGVVIFSFGDNGKARTEGGYGYSLTGPASMKSRFVAPNGASNLLYVTVVDYNYKYMPCGYGGSDSATSNTSLPGECRGQTGVACVQNNGYSMCSNAVGNLYTSTPTHAVASSIVHGLLHNFAPNSDKDHYATPECNARMGYPASFFDLQESEYYNGLCPFVYEEFTKAYRP